MTYSNTTRDSVEPPKRIRAKRTQVRVGIESASSRLAGGAKLAASFYERNSPTSAHSREDARQRVRQVLTDGLTGFVNAERRNLLLRASTGVGKTTIVCEAIRDRVTLTRVRDIHEGVVFVTTEHAVLAEVHAKLRGLGVSVTYLGSGLRDDVLNDAPKCQLPAGSRERKRILQMYGQGFNGPSLCETCDHRDSCEVPKYKPESADVVLATVVDINRAVELAGKNAVIIIDEHHGLHEGFRVMESELTHIERALGYVVHEQQAACESLLAATRLIGPDQKPVNVPPTGEHDTLTLLTKWSGQLHTGRYAPTPTKSASRALAGVRQLMGMWRGPKQPDAFRDPETGELGWRATVKTDLGFAVEGHVTMVLSATPIEPAYDPRCWHVERIDVQDAPGVTITRKHVYERRVGRKALCPRKNGERVVDQDEVELQLRRLVAEDFKPGELSLLGTYKPVADALRPGGSMHWLLEEYGAQGYRITVCHFGAIRGKNIIGGHDVQSFDALTSLGDPWSGGLSELEADLQEDGADLGEAWRQQAAAELAQFHGRARAVQRTRPVRLVHRGEVCVGDWHVDQHIVFDSCGRSLAPEERQRQNAPRHELLTELLEVWGVSEYDVADACGVSRGMVSSWRAQRKSIAPEHSRSLRGLRPSLVSRPGVPGLLAVLNPVRPIGMRTEAWRKRLELAERVRADREATMAGLTDGDLEELDFFSAQLADHIEAQLAAA